eukprot:IDg662t1
MRTKKLYRVVAKEAAALGLLQSQGLMCPEHVSCRHCSCPMKQKVSQGCARLRCTNCYSFCSIRSWADVKAINKAPTGANHLLQYHLDEFSLRKSVRNSSDGFFISF